MKKVSWFILTLISILASASCILDSEYEVESANFEEKSISLGVGEVKQVNYKILPVEALPKAEVKYYVSENSKDIIELSNMSKNGLVITGKKNGNCVVIAECAGITSYLQVLVTGSIEDINPYIVSSVVSSEVTVGNKKTFTVSLYGGSANDNALFEWSNGNQEVCSIEPVGNSVVVSVLKSGSSRLTVSHPKAIYSCSIMVYGIRENESACYITTSQNVVQLGIDEGTHPVTFSLVGSKNNDMSAFSYEVVDGNENIEIIGNNNVCNVTPVKEGASLIRVSHPDCETALEFQVVVVKTTIDKYIESDDNFIIINNYLSKIITCSVIGSNDYNDNYKFKYELSKAGIVEVTQSNNKFYIEPVKEGSVLLKVMNEQCKYAHEIYIIVQDYDAIIDSTYITTSQNVIKMEVGEETDISVMLTNGNESDRNNFVWETDDTSIISLITSDGNTNSRKIDAILLAQAVVKAKKVGIATITVKNPKASTECIIKVFVYAKGTLLQDLAHVNGTGLVKVLKGGSEIHNISVDREISSVSWKSDNENVAKVQGASLSCVVNGIESGITSGRAESDEFSNPYEFIIISGTQEELESYKAIYVQDRYISSYAGTTVYQEINSSGDIDPAKFSASVNDSSIASCRMSENVLIINALKSGKTEIVVSNEDSLNSLVLYLTVFDSISLETPYYFSYDKFFGLVVGQTKELSVDLVGSSDKEKGKIGWNVEDESVVSITGNGEKVRVKALTAGETKLIGKHSKSENDAEIILYTALTEEELESKIILDTEKTNYLSSVGKDLYIEVNVNNPEKNREKIQWSCDDLSLVRIDSNYDNAYIRCLEEGNCVITVTCENSLPLKIYLSILDDESYLYEPSLAVPSVIELGYGQTKLLKAEYTGLNDSDLREISWTNSNDQIISIKGEGENCYIVVLSEGISEITVKLSKYAIEKKILVVTNPSLVVMNTDKAYYNMKKGEELDIKLNFGSNYPSSSSLSSIKWTTNDSDIVSLNYFGEKCTLIARNEGLATVKVKGEGISNEVSFKVSVGSLETVINNYYLSCDTKFLGIVNGESTDITVNLIDGLGNNVIGGTSDISYSIKSDDEAFIDVNQAENVFIIDAIKTGAGYLNFSHPNAKETSVYVYTADTQSELDTYFPLSTNKDHYLLNVGSSVVLKVNTIDESRIDRIKWSCNNSSVCSYSNGEDKTSLKITAKKEGTCTFTVSHADSPDKVVFTVSVSEYDDTRNDIYMLTESILGLVKGETKTTTCETNLSDSEVQMLVWESSDSSIIKVEGNGKNASLKALKKGKCEIKVSYSSKLYRTMVCYVENDENDVLAFHAFNNDRRYYVGKVGDTFNISSYYAKVISQTENTVISDVYGNNVVSFNYEGGLLTVKAENEGLAKLNLSNSECANTFDVFFEIHEKNDGSLSETETGYLSAVKTVYVLDAVDKIYPTEIRVSPVGIEESKYSSIIWSCNDDSVCSVYGNGDTASVFANKKGEATISVYSVYSSNVLNIRVVVSKGGIINTPYIKTDSNTIEVKCGSTEELEFTIENQDSFDVTAFSYEIEDPKIAGLIPAGNRLKVKGYTSGQTLITVSYKDLSPVHVILSTVGVADNIIYLTTDNNYTVISEGKYETLSVKLVGYEEINGLNFNWEVVEGEDCISLSASGSSRVCTGLKPGISKIKVTHTNGANSAFYPLYLTVKVTDYTETNPVYISTDNNVVTLEEDGQQTISVNLINGSESSYNQFDWTNNTASVISINKANNQCVVKGLKKGVGRITVSHPDATPMDILVVVEEKKTEDSLYISTDSTIIEMSPNDSYKQLNVTLVGGTAEQNTLFSWEILSFESTIKNRDGTSNAVINLLGSQDSALIKPLNEGTAIIRVRNSVTSHYLDIKVIITLYNSLNFANSSLTLSEGESTFISINCPTGKTVLYESLSSICTVSGTNKTCYIEAGTLSGNKNSEICVIRAYTSDGSSNDELIVNVKKNNEVVKNYIQASSNIITLNTLDDPVTVNLTLGGSGVTQADDSTFESMIVESQDGVNHISFSGSTDGKIKGNTFTIKPISQGEQTIVITHPKAAISKTIYVSVEQNAASIVLSSTYESMQLGDMLTLSCVLSGVSEAEYENVIWKSSKPQSFALNQADADGNVRGQYCTIKALSYDNAKITCSYGNITKTVSVYCTERDYIGYENMISTISRGSEKKIKIKTAPEDAYTLAKAGKLNLSQDSTLYLTTCVIDIDEVTKDVFVKIVGGTKAGATKITCGFGNLASSFTVNTVDRVNINLDAAYYHSITDNSLVVEENPSNIYADLTKFDYCLLYYTVNPDGLKLDTKEGEYTFADVNKKGTGWSMSSSKFLDFEYGEENGNHYIKITPACAGYGEIELYNKDNYSIGCDLWLPVAFTYSDYKIVPELGGSSLSKLDKENGILYVKRDRAKDILKTSMIFRSNDINHVFYISKIEYEAAQCKDEEWILKMQILVTDLTKELDQNSAKFKLGEKDGKINTRVSESFGGFLRVYLTYPKFNGNSSPEVKTFMLMNEIWE